MWILRPQTLHRLRTRKKLTVEELAERTGLSDRQLRRFAAGTSVVVQEQNLAALASVLGCAPDELATWKDEAPPPPAPLPSVVVERARDFKPVRTDPETAQARLERLLGRHDEQVTLGGKHYPLLGFDAMKQCELLHRELELGRFAIAGEVRDLKFMSLEVANYLRAEQGRGAGAFKITRPIANTGRRTEPPALFSATVFAPRGAVGKTLLDCHRQDIAVQVVATVVCWADEVEGDGFFIFEHQAQPRPWAFVAEEVFPVRAPVVEP